MQNRRSFLKKSLFISCGSAFVGGGLYFWLNKTSDFELFVLVSKNLCAEESLDQELAKIYFNSLITDNLQKNLLKELHSCLTNNKPFKHNKNLTELSQKILKAWYTGTITENNLIQVTSYTNNLIWKKLTFTKPQGVCL